MKFRFNKIIMIQSLSPEHENSELGKPGPLLYDTINKKLTELKSQKLIDEQVDCEYLHVNSLADWEALSHSLVQQTQEGARPILHFICHGDKKEGMSIWDSASNRYVDLSWANLYSVFTEINVHSHNNLFVSMCVCEAFWGLVRLLSDDRIPFTGIVASPDSIYAIDAETRFPQFYAALLTNMNISAAMQELKDGYERIVKQYGDEYAADIKVEFSEVLFLNAYQAETEKRRNPSYLRQRAIEAFQAEGVLPTNDLIQAYTDNYLSHYQEDYRNIRDLKFMFDIYPEERDRFDFPDEI